MGLMKELRDWLRSCAPDYLHQLETIEKKQDNALLAKLGCRYLPKQKFVGAGMCEISSAALAEGIQKKFGTNVTITGITREVPGLGVVHRILRIKGNEPYTIEATHRQIRYRSKPAILVFPSKHEGTMYKNGRVIKMTCGLSLIHSNRCAIRDGHRTGVTMDDFDALVNTLKK